MEITQSLCKQWINEAKLASWASQVGYKRAALVDVVFDVDAPGAQMRFFAVARILFSTVGGDETPYYFACIKIENGEFACSWFLSEDDARSRYDIYGITEFDARTAA